MSIHICIQAHIQRMLIKVLFMVLAVNKDSLNCLNWHWRRYTRSRMNKMHGGVGTTARAGGDC